MQWFTDQRVLSGSQRLGVCVCVCWHVSCSETGSQREKDKNKKKKHSERETGKQTEWFRRVVRPSAPFGCVCLEEAKKIDQEENAGFYSSRTQRFRLQLMSLLLTYLGQAIHTRLHIRMLANIRVYHCRYYCGLHVKSCKGVCNLCRW